MLQAKMKAIERGFQPYATQEVANDMAGICHVMCLASNSNILLRGVFWTLRCLRETLRCMRLRA